MSKYTNLSELFAATADAIRSKDGGSGLISPGDFPEKIMNIPAGGGSVSPGEDSEDGIIIHDAIRFIDYDGTILYTYSPQEIEEMTELPPLPQHEGLICQEWNYTLEDIKEQTLFCEVGATYTTVDGATKCHVSITDIADNNITICLAGEPQFLNVNIDWGDGNAETVYENYGYNGKLISHAYANTGNYVISISSIDSNKYNLGGAGSVDYFFIAGTKSNDEGTYDTKVTAIYLGNDVEYASFGSFKNLEYITLSKTTKIDDDTFICIMSYKQNDDTTKAKLKTVILPRGCTSCQWLPKCNGFNGYISNYRISIPNTVKTLWGGLKIKGTERSIIPNSVTSFTNAAGNNGYDVTYGPSYELNMNFWYPVYIKTTSGTDICEDGAYVKNYIVDDIRNTTGLGELIPWSTSGSNTTAYTKFENTYCVKNKKLYNKYKINIADGNSKIGDYEFKEHKGLTGVTIPNSVTSIGTEAFSGCSNLTSVTIPNSVTSIKRSAFSGCSNLTSVTIPNSVTSIENSIFYGCSNLTSVTIPNSVTSIGTEAFRDCIGLTSVTIPNSVTSIGTEAFKYCQNLRGILTIPKSVNKLGTSVFHFCGPSSNPERLLILDFSSHDNIPTLSSSPGILGYYSSNLTDINIKIAVPFYLYDEWINATNWSQYKKYVFKPFEPTECTSLTITAEDVPGNAKTTKIHYTAILNGKNTLHNTDIIGVEITGDAISDEFPQNTSYTDTVEREVSYTYMGVTATTTITHGVWMDPTVSINLNDGQWELSTTIPNPDESLYDGVYQSVKSKGVNNGCDTMYIDVVGYDTFDMYIRSYGESSYDYVMVSQPDKDITGSTSYSNTTLVKSHTRGKSNATTTIDGYTHVEFTGLEQLNHRITVVYRKDSSGNNGDDRGYVLIPKN